MLFFLHSSHPLTHSLPPPRPPEAISPRKTRVFKATQFTLSRSGNKVRENGEVEGWLGYQVEGGREGWAWEGKMDGWGYVEGGWVIKNKAGNSETVCVREKTGVWGKKKPGETTEEVWRARGPSDDDRTKARKERNSFNISSFWKQAHSFPLWDFWDETIDIHLMSMRYIKSCSRDVLGLAQRLDAGGTTRRPQRSLLGASFTIGKQTKHCV